MNYIKYGLLILASLLLIPASYALDYKNPTGKKYEPVKNPEPSYYISLKGEVLGTNIGPKKLTLVAEYDTMKETDGCYLVVNWFEGADSARIKKKVYVMDLTKPTVDLIIPIDGYQKGFCDWQLADISIKDNKGVTSLFSLRDKNYGTSTNLNLIYSKKSGWHSLNAYRALINQHQNHFYSITIDKRGAYDNNL